LHWLLSEKSDGQAVDRRHEIREIEDKDIFKAQKTQGCGSAQACTSLPSPNRDCACESRAGCRWLAVQTTSPHHSLDGRGSKVEKDPKGQIRSRLETMER